MTGLPSRPRPARARADVVPHLDRADRAPRPARAREEPDLDEEPAPCLFTSGDIARLMAVDRKTVHNWIRVGHLSGLRTPGGQMRFHRAEVVRFMRRFAYPVPARLGGEVSRVAVVGARLAEASRITAGAPLVRVFELLFDAALAAADGGYDLVVVDLDAVALDPALDLVWALRRRPLTRPLPVVGVTIAAPAQEGFVLAGGDAVVPSPEELARVVPFYLGE